MKNQLVALALALSLTITLTESTAAARPPDDINILFPEPIVLKYKPGAPSARLQTRIVLFYTTPADESTNLKASGTISYYLSNDATLSLDDRFITSKPIKITNQKDKRIKVKFPILVEEAGNFLIAVTDSPQDENGPSASSMVIPYL